ncbi:ERI1 exoribonuclease 2 [Lingula anatina]|uniref:ERI1 exoribonuclease 2 n=1 Tax=Lingula anatina TaxID=7574 RepID=A0A1S3HVI9_LINAN|nr:ERI1 exoribonuclease 2 [Lingula anatina]|eukprot:XP_013390057.1 ERI1 exoribonuclease 2 [Lingula anatina]
MMSTKALARELGLLRKRSYSQISEERKIHKNSKQQFSHLIVIDFESTCWEKKTGRPQEIIEFPAVLMNTNNGEVESEFHHYVQPSENPMLSEFCKKLTGISQEQVEEGIPLSLCLSKFNTWIKNISQERKLVFEQSVSEGQNLCTIVTWSDWDLGVCLLYECRRKQIRKPAALNSWIDLRATYRKFYDRRPQGLNGALQDVGIEFEGREHSGLDDARNTAKLAWRMIRDGCVLNVTKSFNGSAQERSETMAKIMKIATESSNAKKGHEPNGACRVAGSSAERLPVQQECGQGTPHSSIPAAPQLSVTSSNTAPHSLHNRVRKIFSTDKTTKSERTLQIKGPQKSESSGNVSTVESGLVNVSKQFETETVKTSSVNVLKIESVSKELKTIASPVFNEQAKKFTQTGPSTISTVNGHRNIKAPYYNQSISKLGDFKKPFSSMSSKLQGNRPYTPSDRGSKMSYHTKCNVTVGVTPEAMVKPSNSAYKTSQNGLGPFSSTGKTVGKCLLSWSSHMKATPPLCDCGRRSKRRVVQNPGPNEGRAFFACPLGRKSSGAVKEGCKFFKWDSRS